MNTAGELLALSDFTFERTRRRLDGLTDAEYLWEPAPDCWSVRIGPDGVGRRDWTPMPDQPPPLTTIAWRLRHLIQCYGEQRNAIWLGQMPGADAFNSDGTAPTTAAGAIAMLDGAHDVWRSLLTSLSDEQLTLPIGAVGASYAEASRMAFVLHMVDEFIHHAAEIGVLRDLHAATGGPTGADPAVDSLLRGERDDVTDAEIERVRDQRPDLARRAATNARWAGLTLLVELGFPLGAGDDGVTPLHLAAAAGRLDAVRLLIDHGADLTARDDGWQATPLEWARHFYQERVADHLAEMTR
jgi:hypothetical protein